MANRKLRANRRGLAFASRKSRSSRRSNRNNRSRKQARRSTRRTRRNRRSTRRNRRNHRGGDYLESALGRPFFASVYPNSMQTTYSTVTGAQPNNYPADSRPEVGTWNYVSNGTIIPPSLITKINTDFNMMTGPTAYNPVALSSDGAGVNAGSATISGGIGSGSAMGSGSVGLQSSIASAMAAGQQSTKTFN